jgi:hypothetical protein
VSDLGNLSDLGNVCFMGEVNEVDLSGELFFSNDK